MSQFQPYKEIILAMLRTGVLGYGGGPAIMPLFRYEAVTRYHWLEDSEFVEVLALANALPGPIATKMAAYLGYHRKGIMGSLVAVIVHILPTTISIVVLINILHALEGSKVVAGMIGAVYPVISVMLGIMAYEFASKAWKGLGKVLGVVLGLLAFVLLSVLHVNAGVVVLMYLAYGAGHLSLAAKWGSRGSNRRREEGRNPS